MKLLIDECLSPELVDIAHTRGHEAAHVTRRGLSGAKDWELKKIILDDDWTFVTANSVDFRGSPKAPGSKGEYRDVPLHAGLICLNSLEGMDIDLQKELFEAALDKLPTGNDLTNQVLEVTCDGDTSPLNIVRYALPDE